MKAFDTHKAVTDSSDYRTSHLQRGGDYDETIAASPFDAYMAKWESYHLDHLPARLFPGKIPRYLDFACGTGRITQQVALSAEESWGVDISPTMLEAARRKCPSTRFILADLTQDDRNLGEFDLVTSFRFFGNAQDELRVNALRAINRLVRTGGYLVINSHRNPHAIAAFLSRATGGPDDLDLSYFKLRRLLERHGFMIEWRRAIAFWTLRAKMRSGAALARAPDQRLESLFQHPWLVPFAPDAILVARKVRSLSP